MEVRAATDAERPAAAERLCGSKRAGEYLVRLFASEPNRFDPQDLLVAVESGELRGVLFAQTLSARLADYSLAEGSTPDVEDELLAFALQHSARRGVKLVQEYLDPSVASAAFERNGFHLATQIEHLVYRGGEPERLIGPILHFASTFNSAAFASTLLATYECSLDAPEANVGATADEIFAGFSPDAQKWLVSQGETPVGVLVTYSKTNDEIEYFGVVPDARGRGIGAAILHHALSHFPRRGIAPVRVTVDTRNRPARRLYDSFGFRVEQVQNLWLRQLP